MEKLSYAIGMSMAQNLAQNGLNNIDVKTFIKAFTDVMTNVTTEMTDTEASTVMREYFNSKQEEMLNQNLEMGRAFLEENKKNAGVVVLPSGLQYQVLEEGIGENPKATDSVKCHYHGTLIDGTVFDSSVQRGTPAVFGVNQVIKGWVEALQLMPVGSKWRLFLPSDLAYGSQGAGGAIKPNSALIFDVELLGIEK